VTAALEGSEASVEVFVTLLQRADALLELDMREPDQGAHFVKLSLVLDRVPVQFLVDVGDPFRNLSNLPSQTLDLNVSLSNFTFQSLESAVHLLEPAVLPLESAVDLLESAVNLLESAVDLLESAVAFRARRLDAIRQVFQPGLNQSHDIFLFHRPDGTSERNRRELRLRKAAQIRNWSAGLRPRSSIEHYFANTSSAFTIFTFSGFRFSL
jgi:hypothetical protein